MSKRRITIRAGEVCGFADEVSFEGLKVSEFKKKRVSTVLPLPVLKRAYFCFLRALVNDNSALAGWTRTWKCKWVVCIDGSKYGPFTDRAEAIRFEKDKIYEQGKLFTGKT
jgi:hypothetical protein